MVGETVNIAARAESLTRTIDAAMLVTQATVDRLGPVADELESVGPHQVNGVSEPVVAYRPR